MPEEHSLIYLRLPEPRGLVRREEYFDGHLLPPPPAQPHLPIPALANALHVLYLLGYRPLHQQRQAAPRPGGLVDHVTEGVGGTVAAATAELEWSEKSSHFPAATCAGLDELRRGEALPSVLVEEGHHNTHHQHEHQQEAEEQHGGRGASYHAISSVEPRRHRATSVRFCP